MAQDRGAKKTNKGQKLSAKQREQIAEKRTQRALEKQKKQEKKAEKKRHKKEVAIIVVSVIMVISVLLPSFSSLMSNSSSKTTKNADGTVEITPTDWDSTTNTYQPKVDAAQAKVDAKGDDQAAMLELADAYYNWASKASSYDSDDEDKKNQVNDLYQKAIDEYTTYLDAVGNFNSKEAKGAGINKAMAYKQLDNEDEAISELKDLANQTNYASAWAQLAQIYDGNSNPDLAMIAYEKAANSSDLSSSNSRSWALQRLTALRNQAQEKSGGASALLKKLDYSQGYTLNADLSNTLVGKLGIKIVIPPDLDTDSDSSSS